MTRSIADHGNCAVGVLGHGVLLVFGAPCQISSLAGREHGRTIPFIESTEHKRAYSMKVRARLTICRL